MSLPYLIVHFNSNVDQVAGIGSDAGDAGKKTKQSKATVPVNLKAWQVPPSWNGNIKKCGCNTV